jgi:hypothetical protein
LYHNPAFGAFDDFSDFVESISCETSKACQVRGSSKGTWRAAQLRGMLEDKQPAAEVGRASSDAIQLD